MRKPVVRVIRGACPALVTQLEQQVGPVIDWFSEHAHTIKKTDHSSVGFVELGGTSVYIKVFLAQGLAQRFSVRMGRHRALRGFAAARQLLKAQLSVPAPIACLQMGRDMLLVTQRLPEGDDLLSLWRAQGERLPSTLWAQAGTIVGQLHTAGFVHGDCKWSNIYSAQERLYFVDLEAVARVGSGSSVQYRDVARFVLNAEDMGAPPAVLQAFMSAYAQEVDTTIEEAATATLPQLKRLRLRHEHKYGKRGHRLLQD